MNNESTTGLDLWLENPPQSLRQRRIFIWGAQWLGAVVSRGLARRGFEVEAFIDKNPAIRGEKIAGRPILDADGFWADFPAGAFVILASEQNAASMEEVCLAAGLTAGRDYLVGRDLKPNIYCIEISGFCNLKCISCPCGNYEPKQSRGLMSARVFASVLDKIIKEDPRVLTVPLHNINEPLLNPELPEIVSQIKQAGLESYISTNLNHAGRLEDLLKAGPTLLKVSASGFGPQTYEVTHTGGRWEALAANLRRLRDLREKYSPDVQIEIGYHLYQHNCGRERDLMRALVHELGFMFRETLAFIMPLNTIAQAQAGLPLTGAAAAADALLLMPVREALDRLAAEDNPPQTCPEDRCLLVRWDLSMRTCNIWQRRTGDPGPRPGEFLEKPLGEMQKAKSESDLCRHCRSLKLHRWFSVYDRKDLMLEKVAARRAEMGL